jgi:hypothetical protein
MKSAIESMNNTLGGIYLLLVVFILFLGAYGCSKKCNPYKENCEPKPPEMTTRTLTCHCTDDYRTCICHGETYIRKQAPLPPLERPISAQEE